MIVTYRRTGGLFLLFTVAAVALVATVVTVAAAALVLIVAVAGGAAALLVRAVLPRSWRRRAGSPTTSPTTPTAIAESLDIIEGHVVNTAENEGKTVK